MARIRAVIVDDEPIARRGVRTQLKSDPGIEIVEECVNGLEAVEAIRESLPDLVFLDIQMPEMDGFDVIEAVGPEQMPTVIFVTAYDRYAIRAFEVHALDYLLKPFDRERFRGALRRAKEHIQRDAAGDLHGQLSGLLRDHRPARTHLERLVVKSAARIFFLNVDDVDWMESADNYVRLHTGAESYLIRGTLNGMEARLNPDVFLRIRHSAIVNIKRVKELHAMFHGQYSIVLRDGTQLLSSRRHAQRIKSLLRDW